MPIGTVKLWNEDRGFGFIRPDGDGPDVFVHAKNLDGASELVPSQRVEYETEFDRTRGKYHAADVRVI
jgi:CspA family cold shock protein